MFILVFCRFIGEASGGGVVGSLLSAEYLRKGRARMRVSSKPLANPNYLII